MLTPRRHMRSHGAAARKWVLFDGAGRGWLPQLKMHCQHLSTHFKPAVPFVWLGFQDEVAASQGFPAIDKVCLVVWKCSLH